ncbi:MAG: hypothetical protein J5794_07460 [Lachnospiraceae bacterium]|nr:hypothetical protein [Lachnospiraceae bacterium]
MIEVREAKSKKEQREFLNFPLKLYKDCPYYAPALYMDEKKIFRKDYVYYDTCKAVYFNAYKDGVMAGRISGILQGAANEKNHEKRIRFTRYDVIDDPEVSKALFQAVEDWGRSLGMEEIVGPLGFSDLEREGLLIGGFDQMATFEEQYNAPYYQAHIEALGFEKEVDWVESAVRLKKEEMENLDKLSEMVMRRYKLHRGEAKNTKDFLRKYQDDFFSLLDKSYDKVYGTVPFTEGMKKMMIDNFNLIINMKYVAVILDEQENPVCFGICFPALGEALKKSGGKLTPAALPRVLYAIRHPKVIDFGLIGVDPAWENRGVSVCMAAGIMHMLEDDQIEHAETNLNLVDNAAIRNLWKRFNSTEHKWRRAYRKKL